MSRLLRALMCIVIRNFRRSKKNGAIFNFDCFVCVFHFVLAIYQTYFVVSSPVVRHFCLRFAGSIDFRNIKNIEMTNVLIDVFTKELIDVWTSVSQNILIKFFDGNRTHFACKNQRYEIIILIERLPEFD